MKSLLTIVILLSGIAWSSPLCAQSSILPMSPEVLAAYAKGSRSVSGAPGEAYFVNRAAYDIQADFDPESRQLQGLVHITYTNHSPDTLKQIVIRTHQDLYAVDSPNKGDIDANMTTEGFVLHELVLEGDTLVLVGPSASIYREHTNLYLMLPESLLPSESVSMDIRWEITVPKGRAIRMGTYGEHAYFVGYWYPQIAVYDDVYGWDTLPYNGVQEFYQDIADFTAEIRVPNGYLLWATGEWQNPADILQPTYLSRYEAAQTSDSVISIVGKSDYEQEAEILQDNKQHSWKFRAPNVPDFAFAVSDFYLWDGSSVLIEETGKRVFIDACYQPKARDFAYVTGFAREAIADMSKDLPGIPFPYAQFTTFNGEVRGNGGGMEFPMMANNGSCYSLSSAFDLTYHEIAHTYFPFGAGINEKRFAWMDEGWAELFPLKMMEEKGYSKNPLRWNTFTFASFAGSEGEAPLMTSSSELRGQAYYVQAYYRSSLAYFHLQQYLGKDLFRQALQTYYRRWEGKHPLPYDFFHTFEEIAGQDLDWFWQPWFFETAAPDLALNISKLKKKKVQLTVERKGNLPLPVFLQFELEGGKTEKIAYPVDIWKDGGRELSVKQKFKSKIIRIKLGESFVPDGFPSDNSFAVEKEEEGE